MALNPSRNSALRAWSWCPLTLRPLYLKMDPPLSINPDDEKLDISLDLTKFILFCWGGGGGSSRSSLLVGILGFCRYKWADQMS